MEEQRQTKAAPVKYWQGKTVESNHDVWLVPNADRHLGKKCHPVQVARFGPLPDPQPAQVPHDHPTLDAAINFLIPICENFCKGDLKDKLEVKAATKQKSTGLALPTLRIPCGEPRTVAERYQR